MKVVVTGTRGIPDILGGVETHCQELFPRVVRHGIDVTLIRRACYVDKPMAEYEGVKLVDVATPKSKAFEAIIHTVKAVWLARFRYDADIVHIHAIGPALVTPLARMLGLKVVFTHHGHDYDRDKWGRVAKLVLRLGERMGTKYANRVISISNVITDNLRRLYGRQDIDLIYNGVPQAVRVTDADYLKSLNVEPHRYIFAMGRFVPEKNFHHLIEAFGRINAKGYKLVLAGDNMIEDDYSRSLKLLAKDHDVVLTGFIKGLSLQTLLTNAAGFVLPSSHEGLPIALLEAMSYDLPVVVSDIPANKAVGLADGCYFHTGNIDELESRLQTMVESDFTPVKYDMKEYDWDRIAQQVVSVYESIF
jgi:glycosyltransferase involved in cell wall biosynthesis